MDHSGDSKSIREGDLVCLLQGASRPSIIRPHHDFFDIIIIAAWAPEDVFPRREGHTFTRDLLLVWDWESSSDTIQRPVNYEDLVRTKTGVFNCSTELKDQLDKPIRIWNMALILADVEEDEEDEEAEKKLQEAISGYEIAFGVERYTMEGQDGVMPFPWVIGNRYHTVARQILREGKAEIDLDLKDRQYGKTSLSWAAENRRGAVVDVDTKHEDEWTPLLWATENGYVAVVKLLLETGKVDVNAKDRYGQTPLQWAVEYKHQTVVKLLLQTGKVNFNVEDQDGWKLLL